MHRMCGKGYYTMKKKNLATVLALSMLTVTLCSCGVSSQGEANAGGVKTEEKQTAVAETGGTEATENELPAVSAFGYELDLNPGNTLHGQYEGQTLTVFCCTGEFSEPLQESIDIFQKLSGATVNLYIYSFDELNSKIALALSGDEEMDIACFVSAYMDTFNSVGQLANLTELSETYGSADYNWDGFSKALLNRTSDANGVFAVPYQICEMMGFYRKDLLEDTAVQEAYKEQTGKELKIPETAEELSEIAAFFSKSQNPDSSTSYGYLSQGVTNAAMWSWMTRLGSFGGTMFGENWTQEFDSPAGVEAMEFGKAMLSYSPDNWNEYGFDEVNNLMTSGEVFFCENWSSAYPSLNTGDMTGKIGTCVTPGKSPVISGWSLGVNALSEKQELAWKFIEFCTAEDSELTRVDNGVAPAREYNFQRLIDAGEDADYYTSIMNSLACEDTCWGDICLPYLGSQGSSIIDTYTQAMYKGEISAQEALDQMASDISAALKSVGIE